MENGSSGGCGFLYKFGGDGVYSVIVLSRNDAVGRAVPPHPGPLPRGEGEPFGSAIKGHRLVSFPPSPWGEDLVEGERDVRTAWIRLVRKVHRIRAKLL